MHLLTTVAGYSTARGLRSFRLAQPHECSPKAATSHTNKTVCVSGLQQHPICTEDVTAVRRTLQRLQMCSRDTIAFSTWSNPYNECQLIDIFYSLIAASICCHRARHPRDTTVIHACLQPTRGLCLKADLNFCVRPSVRGTPSPTTHSERLFLRVGTLPCAPTYNRGVVQHVVFNRFGLAQPHECSSKAATCHANSAVQAASNGI